MRVLKVLGYAALLLVLYLFINAYLMTNDQPKETKKQPPVSVDHNDEQKSVLSLLGEPKTTIEHQFGSPDRIDDTPYGYKWWIYNKDPHTYMQVGILNEQVVTIFASGESLNLAPVKIGDSTSETLKNMSISSTVKIKDQANDVRFEISEQELTMCPLVKMSEDQYAILYFDQFDKTLSSVRFMNKDVLLMIRPYSLTYRGSLAKHPVLTDEQKASIDRANEQQIFDITNVFRARKQLKELKWNEQVAKVAYSHSNDMREHHFFAHESELNGDLSNRLSRANLSYTLAGENIAAKYIDGPAATLGWLNSEGHRKVMFTPEFTEIGVGVSDLYYTQDYLRK